MENESAPTYRLHLHRTIKATAEQAFRAFADPEQLSQWFTKEAHSDLQKGGAYSNADGDRGTYLDINAPTRLTFTWDNPEHCPGSIVTLTFRDAAKGRVLVRLLHRELKSAADVDHMREGWQWALTNLKYFLEESRTITFEEWQQLPRRKGAAGRKTKSRA
jgi:uncharacterized protein YndB with AHSA1/START domain